MQNLTSLKLHENWFSCTVPSSWASLTRLSNLFLHANQLQGPLPLFLSGAARLQNLLLFSNRFTSTIPASYGGLTNLQILWVRNNSLVGSIPTSFRALTRMQSFIAQNNGLQGPIGTWLGNWPRLRALNLASNLFTSSIPEFVSALRSLELLFLQDNKLTSTLSPSLGSLGNLSAFNASCNFLGGSLPSQLGQLSMLQYMDLSSNKLTSSLPPSLARLSSLLYLFLESNSLVGPIPTAFGSSGSLTRLQQIRLRNNRLTGGIPTQLGLLSSLVNLYLSNNTLGGTLPTQLGQISGLHSLYLDRNGLIGTLPAVLCSSWTRMSKLRLGYNSISGTLPSTFTMMTAITSVRFPKNSFMGRIPQDLTPLKRLKNFQIPFSRFTGPIPTSLGLLKTLAFISLAANQLTSTLPSQLSGLSAITYLDVHGNNLVSNPTIGLDFFNVSNTPMLQYFDVSSNNFSGTIPNRLFSIPSSRTVVLARNCMQGALPSTVCNCKLLQTLVLDGLAAGDGCQIPLWPEDNSLGFDAMLAQKMSGSIPKCIFSMPKLQLLHLAGNAFTGPAFDPAQTSFPPNLTDLSLSNNMLSRHIPSPLQRQAGMLAKLDVSYNKLNGTLSDMQMPSSLLNMIVNRFSGSVPSALLNNPRKPMNFSILSGNAFTCADKSSGLPQFDPSLEDVQCGSNSMNIYMYVLSGLLAALGAAWFYFSPHSHLQGDHEDKADALDELPHIKTFLAFMTQMIRLLQVLTVLCILLLMPIYGAITATSETQTDSYIWTISAAYKSGASAATGLFFLFSTVLVAAFALSLKHQALSLRSCCGGVGDALVEEEEDEDLFNDEGDKEDTYHHQKKKSDEMVLSVLAFRMFFIFSLNTIFAFTTNVGFVFLMNIATAQQQTLAQISMSVLNAVWDKIMAFVLSTRLLYFGLTENDIRSAVLRKPSIAYFREGEVFTASLGVFSQVLAPIAASMVQSPNCFKALFYKPDPVESSYYAPVSYIEYFDSIRLDFEISNLRLYLTNVNFSTIATDVVTNQVIFYAPFQYLFQCSSAILSSYAPVMLNSAITNAFVGPIKMYGIRKLIDSGRAPKAARHVLLNMLPKLSQTRKERQEALEKVKEKLRLNDLNEERVILGPRAFRQKHNAELDEARQLWSRNDFFVGLITDLALLLSFGVACPPLGVALIVSILSSVLLQRHLISAFVAYTSRPASISPTDVKKLQAIIDADAVNAGDVRELLRLEKDVRFDAEGTPVFFARWMVLTVSCSFLSFFVFDTAGDQQGAVGAAWAFIVQILVPLAVAIVIEILFRSRAVSFCRTHSESAAKANDASRMQRSRSSGSISFHGNMEMEMVAPPRSSRQLPRLSSSSSRPQHERKSFSFPRRPSTDQTVLSPLPLSAALPDRAETEEGRRSSNSWVAARLDVGKQVGRKSLSGSAPLYVGRL